MRTRRQEEKRISDVDVLYRVDPTKLSIKICYTSKTVDQVDESTTNFENFNYKKVVVKPAFPKAIGKLPAYVEGLFYFASEEEAQDFIKKQIGL